MKALCCKCLRRCGQSRNVAKQVSGEHDLLQLLVRRGPYNKNVGHSAMQKAYFKPHKNKNLSLPSASHFFSSSSCSHSGKRGSAWVCTPTTCATRDFHFGRMRSWLSTLDPAHQYRWFTTALVQDPSSSKCRDLAAAASFFLMPEVKYCRQGKHDACRAPLESQQALLKLQCQLEPVTHTSISFLLAAATTRGQS